LQAVVPPRHAVAPMTADVRRSPRRGTSSACATKGMHLTARTRDRACLRDASFARSFDPCSSILTTLCGESFGGEALELVSRLGKLAKARGTSTGTGLNGRNAARHVSPLCFRKETERRDASRKGRRSRPPSLRGLKSSGLVARTSNCSCRSQQATSWPRISSAYALQKERSGSSERGSSSERLPADETVGGYFGRRDDSRVGLTGEKTGEDRHRPTVARERHQRS
jgi:hypothetical protein